MVCFRKGAALMRGFIVKNPPQATIANLPIAVVPIFVVLYTIFVMLYTIFFVLNITHYILIYFFVICTSTLCSNNVGVM
jgi:hypothetical protein